MAIAAPVHPEVPRLVELEAQDKKRVLAAIKTALGRLQAKGRLPAGLEYGAMLNKPAALKEFIDAYKADRAVAADLVVDKAGRPVASDDQPLVCGLSLAQICQMLVYTCAKRMFVEAEPETKPTSFGLGGLLRKAPAPQPRSDGERKLAELKNYLAFDWQLPLLKYYYFFLDRHQLAEIGRDILLLRDPAQLEVASSFDVAKLRQARRIAGGEFAAALVARPACIGGLAQAQPQDYAFFRGFLEDRVWDFYARDQDFIDDVMEMDRGQIEAIGPVLADAAIEAVQALAKLPAERIVQLLQGFREVFGADVALLLADAGFARQTLAMFVERFLVVDGDADRFVELVVLKCQALRPTLAAWLEKRRSGG